MSERIELRITGMVQGVFFRASTQAKAHELGLTGWVRNAPDGSVELVAEGHAEALAAFERWCHAGPSAARVDRVDARRATATGEFASFHVRR